MTTIEILIDETGEPVLVGQAHFTRRRGEISTTFLYDPSYLVADGMSIDPALPLVSGAQHQNGLVRAFADSAPDRWGRNLIEKAERARAREESRAPRRLDDLDFLLGVSDDTRQGSLRYRLPGSPAFLGKPSRVPRPVSLPELLRASDELAADEDPSAAVKQFTHCPMKRMACSRWRRSAASPPLRPGRGCRTSPKHWPTGETQPARTPSENTRSR